jgi:NTP pyrophosphatase (non-canonical NTP hydrolase)
MGKSITSLIRDIHENAISHGWWDEKRSFGDITALIHSEVSEAFEEHRNGKPNYYIVDGKPEGKAVELADVIIRILDWAGSENVDMESIIENKHKYNISRPFRHGGKKL